MLAEPGGPAAAGTVGARPAHSARGHLPPRRRRPVRQHGHRHPERGLAAELAGDPRRSASASAPGRRCSPSPRGCRTRWRRANARAPRCRPSLALRDGEPYLAFGTPGGDQQDQWTLAVLPHPRALRPEPAGGHRRARLPHHPLPLVVLPADVVARWPWTWRSAAGADVIAELRERGHRGDGAGRRGRWAGQRGRAGRRVPVRGGQPARHAGLRRRPLTRPGCQGRAASLSWPENTVTARPASSTRSPSTRTRTVPPRAEAW